jgi:hypothetical protein
LPNRKLTTGVGAFYVILVSLAVVFISDPQLVFTGAWKTLEVVRHSQQWMTLASRPEVIPAALPVRSRERRADGATAIEDKPKAQRITIRYGSTIYGIATDVYGANAVLGMDLIKEFNPLIQNLNWVSAGQEMLLPILNPETLLRQQRDGSYRLILGSFFSQKEADQLAGRIIKSGYHILITPKQLTNNLALYRLEIDSLKNLSEASETLEAGIRNQWLSLPLRTAAEQLIPARSIY